ncbi:MAG TPA: FtsQ-type POTRA domain-containing protein [Chthoniobacterales bacterium]|nr:FtsQ-type POTRA domain-containing protein [Chthoniobacterales bacterium]
MRTRGALLLVAGLISIVTLLAGIAFGAKRAVNALFFSNPDYAVKTIDVTTDGNLTREAILRAGGINEGDNIFAIDLPKVRAGLAALPEVEDSRVQRILPNKLMISIQERRPVAWVVPPETNIESFNFENAFLVDERGILLKTKSLAPEFLGLPLIIGIGTSNYQAGQPLDQDEAKAALDLIRASNEILQGRFQIQTIDVSKRYCMTVTDRQHASVTFNIDGVESQLHRLALVLNYCDANSRELQTVNLMAERNVPVTFIQSNQSQPPEDSTAATNSAGTPGPEASAKPGASQAGVAAQAAQSSKTTAVEPNSQEHKQQKKHEHAKLKPFRERRPSSNPSAATGVEERHSEPRVRRALPVDTTRSNG